MSTFTMNGAPNKDTVGTVGDICIDELTGNRYILKFIMNVSSYNNSYRHYIWEIVRNSGGQSSSGDGSSTLVDVITGDSYTLEVLNGKLMLRED